MVAQTIDKQGKHNAMIQNQMKLPLRKYISIWHNLTRKQLAQDQTMIVAKVGTDEKN
jgi:hypothetical protein